MHIEEFQRLIQLGLGRAIIHLQQHDAAPYREVIAYACAHNITYDPLIEGYKETYLFDIIQLTGEKEFYYRKILDAAAQIDGNTPDRDAHHLMALLIRLAHMDNREARSLLYSLFGRNITPGPIWWAFNIIHLDGLAGFIFVVKKLANHDPDFSDVDSLLSQMNDYYGEKRAQRLLNKEREFDIELDTILKKLEATQKPRKKRKKIDYSQISYDDIREVLDTPPGTKPSIYQSAWGRFTSMDNLILAANGLSKETDPIRLINLLKIFTVATFPLDPRPIIALTQHDHDRVWRLAYSALDNVTHPEVRAFALAQIDKGKRIGWALDLLAQNFQQGDWLLIEKVTRAADSLDEDERHMIQMAVRRIFEANPALTALNALMNVYEIGPCGFCRKSMIADFHEIGAYPEKIQAECFWDSNTDIRELAENGFRPVEA